MADIQYWNDTLSGDIEAIQGILNDVASSAGSDPMERSRLLDQADRRLRGAQGTKRSFKMECRLVTNAEERRRHEAQLARHESALDSLASDLKAARAEGQRGELFLGANTGGGGAGGDGGDGVSEGDALLKDASNVQDKTQVSIDNIERMSREAKDVGMETMEELKRQRNQIKTIDEEAMGIEDNLVRADKLIRTFGRRMATDRMIQCFACVNVVLLVAVIVFSIVKSGGIPGTGDSGPSNPVRMLRNSP